MKKGWNKMRLKNGLQRGQEKLIQKMVKEKIVQNQYDKYILTLFLQDKTFAYLFSMLVLN